MLEIDGVWSVSYTAVSGGIDGGDPDEIATLILKEGVVSGHDPYGGKYSGTYNLIGDSFSAHVTVEKTYVEAITIFDGLDYPLQVELSGNYTSPDFFSATGKVNDVADLAVNCKRVGDSLL